MSTTITITPKGSGFAVTIPSEASQHKAKALEQAKAIVQVKTPDEQKAAIQAVAVLKGISKEVEATRVEIKKPYLAAGTAIDEAARSYKADIDARAAELETMIAGFQRAEAARVKAEQEAEQRRIREAAEAASRERARLAEAERIQQQQTEAAERARRAAQQAELDALEADTPEEIAAAEERVRQQQAEAQAAELRAKEAQQDAQQAEIDVMEASEDAQEAASTIIVSGAASKATGAAVRGKLEIEVTDIEALYAWDLTRRDAIEKAMKRRPMLGIIKMELSTSSFRDMLKTMAPEDYASIPGVKITETTKVAVRAQTFGGFQ